MWSIYGCYRHHETKCDILFNNMTINDVIRYDRYKGLTWTEAECGQLYHIVSYRNNQQQQVSKTVSDTQTKAKTNNNNTTTALPRTLQYKSGIVPLGSDVINPLAHMLI